MHCPGLFVTSPSAFLFGWEVCHVWCVSVVWLHVRGRVGVATLASGVLFVARRGACVRVRAGSGQSNFISRRRRTCLNFP